MKTPLITVLIALLMQSASANCYMVYDREDRLAFRSISTPVNLSQPIREQVQRQWPGGSLIIAGDSDACSSIDVRAQAQSLGSLAGARDVVENIPSSGAGKTMPTGSGSRMSYAGKDLNVRPYTKKDGTQVQTSTRSAPGSNRGGRRR